MIGQVKSCSLSTKTIAVVGAAIPIFVGITPTEATAIDEPLISAPPVFEDEKATPFCMMRASSTKDELANPGIRSPGQLECFDSYLPIAQRLGYTGPERPDWSEQDYITEAERQTGGPSGIEQRVASGTNILAVHTDNQLMGSSVTAYGGDCKASSINWAGTSWDNRMRATVFKRCGDIKHYNGVFEGSMQRLTGFRDNIQHLDGGHAGYTTSTVYE